MENARRDRKLNCDRKLGHYDPKGVSLDWWERYTRGMSSR